MFALVYSDSHSATSSRHSQTGDSRTGTSFTDDSFTDSNTGTGTGTAVSTLASFTTASEALSSTRLKQIDGLRKEVEALVRHVVPEEMENVDEMMMQFAGREEELIETLRNMQERAIAQRARITRHKAAQEEVRRSCRKNCRPPMGLDVYNSVSFREQSRTKSKEQTIQKGYWDEEEKKSDAEVYCRRNTYDASRARQQQWKVGTSTSMAISQYFEGARNANTKSGPTDLKNLRTVHRKS